MSFDDFTPEAASDEANANADAETKPGNGNGAGSGEEPPHRAADGTPAGSTFDLAERLVRLEDSVDQLYERDHDERRDLEELDETQRILVDSVIRLERLIHDTACPDCGEFFSPREERVATETEATLTGTERITAAACPECGQPQNVDEDLEDLNRPVGGGILDQEVDVEKGTTPDRPRDDEADEAAAMEEPREPEGTGAGNGSEPAS